MEEAPTLLTPFHKLVAVFRLENIILTLRKTFLCKNIQPSTTCLHSLCSHGIPFLVLHASQGAIWFRDLRLDLELDVAFTDNNFQILYIPCLIQGFGL